MSKLEKVTHVLLILVCCVSLALLAQPLVTLAKQAIPGRKIIVPIQKSMTGVQGAVTKKLVGDEITLPGSWIAPTTLVIGLRSDCHYCAASLPFYRQLTEKGRQSKSRLAVFVVSPEPPNVVRDFLSKANVTPDEVYQSDLGALGMPGTPTMLIVDSQGIIKQKFVGELTEPREKAVLAMIESPSISQLVPK